MEVKIDKTKILKKCEILAFVDYVKSQLFPSLLKCEDSELCYCKACEYYKNNIGKRPEDVLNKLDELGEILLQDLNFFYDSDPACNGIEEVVMTYPGFLAILYHRIAHIIYQNGNKIAARIISEEAHYLTGIDINPGAKIGSPFFIDHGTGIVIGETAVIGDRVKIYQGVTLGALSLSKGHQLQNQKRHPTVGNNVTIYSGASILGDIYIGDNVVIGSNVFLTQSVEANHKVVLSKPELIFIKK